MAAAEFGRRNLLITICAEVARDYVAARAFQRRLAVAEANLQAQEQILALTRDRFGKGLTGELDVEEADGLLAATRAQTPVFETGFRDAVYQLALLLGQPPGALLDELTNAAPIPAAPRRCPSACRRTSCRGVPDVQQAERQLAAATARVGAAAAELYPKFSLTGDAGLQSISAGDWFAAGSRFWTPHRCFPFRHHHLLAPAPLESGQRTKGGHRRFGRPGPHGREVSPRSWRARGRLYHFAGQNAGRPAAWRPRSRSLQKQG